MQDFLESAKLEFKYYKSLGDKTIAQLTEEEMFHSLGTGVNSIGIIVKHMWGNMMSRWTDIFNSDGEKKWRKREEEFEGTISTKEELLEKWNEGWNCLFKALDDIKEEDFEKLMKKFNEVSNENCNLKDELKKMDIELMDAKEFVSLKFKLMLFFGLVEVHT
jgi:hypothetical protein